MRGASFKWQLFTAAALLAVIQVDARVTRAQTKSPPALPANWQQLSPTDFASLVRQYFETSKSLSQSDQEDLAAHGAQLFSQIDISSTSLSYQTLEMLEWVGRALLDQDVLQKARNAVMARRDSWAGQPYSEIRAKVVMMMRLKVPSPVLVMEARRWVVAGGTLAQVPQRDLTYDIVRQIFDDLKIVTGSFEVEWVAQINAPQTGDYTFFISPIDINAGFQQRPLKFTMTVSLAGQEIINATPPNESAPLSSTYRRGAPPKSNWVSQSNPIPLTAGTPVALRVVATASAPTGLPSGLLHAMLFWQGPGIAKSLVPGSSLTQAGTGTPGVKATYTWTAKGKEQSLTRIEPVIDSSWTNSTIILGKDPTIADQAADAMWQAMVSADFIASLVNATPRVKLHPFLRDADDASSGLSTGRRRAFLDLLLQNPTLLDAMDAKLAVRFYAAFRVGTPEKALDVFGTWAGRQANLECDLSADSVFDGDNRDAFASMAIYTTQQFPQQATRLKSEYLQLPGGGASLPVAYTLTYSFMGLRTLPTWNAFLNAQIANQSVTGDLRVNWLLARAHAEEHLRLMYDHYPFRWFIPKTRIWDGKQFLLQALQTAQSPAVKVRVAREIAGRLAATQQFQAAIDFLKEQANSLPGPQQALLTTWEQQLAGFLAAEQQAKQAQPAEAKQAYLRILQTRRARAAAAGDTTAITRYDALINAVQSRP